MTSKDSCASFHSKKSFKKTERSPSPAKARDLVKILRDAKQVVPQALEQLSGGGFGGGYGGGGGGFNGLSEPSNGYGGQPTYSAPPQEAWGGGSSARATPPAAHWGTPSTSTDASNGAGAFSLVSPVFCNHADLHHIEHRPRRPERQQHRLWLERRRAPAHAAAREQLGSAAVQSRCACRRRHELGSSRPACVRPRRVRERDRRCAFRSQTLADLRSSFSNSGYSSESITAGRGEIGRAHV